MAVGFFKMVITTESVTSGQFEAPKACNVSVTVVLILSELLGVYVVLTNVLFPKVPVPEEVQ